MDRQKIIDVLGLVPNGGLSITDIQMVQWGRDLVLACRYQTTPLTTSPDPPVHFNLVFHDCREIRYKVYAHIGEHEQGQVTPIADVAELLLGHGNHRRDANILTNHFGLTIAYGKLIAERGDETFNLGD
jgi:hypothetical protein